MPKLFCRKVQIEHKMLTFNQYLALSELKAGRDAEFEAFRSTLIQIN